MTERQDWSRLMAPLRGAGYVIGIGVLIAVVGAAIAAVLVWMMT